MADQVPKLAQEGRIVMSTNPKHDRPRRRPLFRIEAEALEGRQLLTGGAGSTIALSKGTIATAGATVSTPFNIDSSHFTMTKSGKITIGVDVVADTNSKVTPKIVSITPAGATTGRVHPIPIQSAGPTSHAVTATVSLPAKGKGTVSNYVVNIQGTNKTSGDYLLGFYLPGDADGNGKVDKADLAAIKKIVGKASDSSLYNFEADANRDGKITSADLAIAKANLGAATTITPDVTANLDPASDAGASDRITNIKTVKFTGAAAPGAAITYHETSLKTPDAMTTADSAGNYTVSLPLAIGTNSFHVTAVDSFGQTIQGDIQPVTYTTGTVPTTAAAASTTSTSTSTVTG